MGWRWKKGGGGVPLGPRFFPADRKAELFFRSLFDFGTVEFGIADAVWKNVRAEKYAGICCITEELGIKRAFRIR
jgi:hypothetical protein